MPLMYSAVSQADVSILDSLPATTSSTSCVIASGERRLPSIFERMCLTDSGVWDRVTSAIPLTDTPAVSWTDGGTSTVPLRTRVSDTETMAIAADVPVILTRSPSLTDRTRQSSSCRRTVGSDVSRS